MPPPPGRDELAARIRRFQAGASPEPFERLLLDVHAWQREHAPTIAALSPPAVSGWTDVPAVPVDLYKRLAVGTVPEGEGVTFRTSGTTQVTRGAHRLWTTELYDHGAVAWARACVPALPTAIAALLPADAHDSSLAHMTRLLGDPTWHLVDGRPDRSSLQRRVAEGAPLFVVATAFALADWLDGDVPALPPGSVLMVTGGFKGRVVALSDAELYAAAGRLQAARLVTEYGMTELSSQLWGAPGLPYRPPPWLRAVAVDPGTGAPLPPGEEGQLRFYDLANLDSSVGVETMDAGVVYPDGSLSLRGRLADAEPRGCSLPAEAGWLGEEP